MGCSIIPGGIPPEKGGIPPEKGGIPPEKGGIPPGTHLGSQVGLAGSHLIFLPGHEHDTQANKFKLGSHAETENLLRIQCKLLILRYQGVK